jgi:hypothetical protein
VYQIVTGCSRVVDLELHLAATRRRAEQPRQRIVGLCPAEGRGSLALNTWSQARDSAASGPARPFRSVDAVKTKCVRSTYMARAQKPSRNTTKTPLSPRRLAEQVSRQRHPSRTLTVAGGRIMITISVTFPKTLEGN